MTEEMDLRQAWKMSKLPYTELAYKSNELISGSSSTEGSDAKHFRSTLRGAQGNKVRFTIFVCLGAVIPFGVFAYTPTPFLMVSAIALCLTVSFAFLVLFSLQVTPSFASAEAYALLRTLPFDERDFSRVTMMSFVRTFDLLAAGSILVPVGAIAYLTHSVEATLLMFGASIVNTILAVFVGLWFSSLFYRSITSGGRSKRAELSRTLFIISWGFAVLFVGFAFYSVASLLPYVNAILAGNVSQLSGVALSVLHPFTFGLVISSVVFPGLFASTGQGVNLFATLDYAVTAAYVVVAFLAISRTTKMISSITHGQAIAVVRVAASDFILKLRGPLLAFIRKDVRIATKNPATAFVFALPLFEPVVILIAFSRQATGTIFDVVLFTMIGAIFPLLAGSILLHTETRSLQYTRSLPIGRQLMVNAKSLIATLIYLPLPFTLVLLQHMKLGVWSITGLIPFVTILTVGAATVAQIAILVTGRSPGQNGSPATLEPSSMLSGSSIGRTIKAYLVAVALIAVPVASYLLASSVYPGSLSIIAMTSIAVGELLAVNAVLRRRG